MTITTLQERIANAEARIEKKQATITKKQGWIEKKQSKLNTLDENARFWAECDIKYWTEDIERASKEITEIQASIENYKKQLAGEIEREAILIHEIPESMKRMQTELVERWDRFDMEKRERLNEEYKALGWTEFSKKHTRADADFRYKTNEQIHKDNMNDARCLIIDLYNRVKKITGEITDWSNIRAEQGTWGFTVLNGYVEGKQGRCAVESIFAGGYNIQRLHIRVLTHEIA